MRKRFTLYRNIGLRKLINICESHIKECNPYFADKALSQLIQTYKKQKFLIDEKIAELHGSIMYIKEHNLDKQQTTTMV